MDKIKYSYTPDQVRVFPPSQDAIKEVDNFRTQLEVWLSRKPVQVDRSDRRMN